MINEEKFLDVFTDINLFYDAFKDEKEDAFVVPGSLLTTSDKRVVHLENAKRTKEFKLTKYLAKDPLDVCLTVECIDETVSNMPFSYVLTFKEEGAYYEGDYLEKNEEKGLYSFYLSRSLMKSDGADQIKEFDYQSLDFISKFLNKSMSRIDVSECAEEIGVMPDKTFPVKKATTNQDAIKNAFNYISERRRSYWLGLEAEAKGK